MVVTVPLALEDEFPPVPRQEKDRVLRLYIFGMLLLQFKAGDPLACLDIILAELGVVLVAVQLDEVEALGIRCPCDVSEITVCGVACIQVDGLLCGGIVDTYG